MMLGWECPICHACYAPTVTMCVRDHTPTRYGSGSAQAVWGDATVTINGEKFAVANLEFKETQ